MTDPNNTGGFVAPRNSAPQAPAQPAQGLQPQFPPMQAQHQVPQGPPPGAAGGPPFMFTPPTEVPQAPQVAEAQFAPPVAAPPPAPDPTLGVQGGAEYTAQQPFQPPVQVAASATPVQTLPPVPVLPPAPVGANAPTQPLQGFSVQPAAAPSPTSGMTPEQKAARAKAIADAAAKANKKGGRRLKLPDTPDEVAQASAAQSAAPNTSQAPAATTESAALPTAPVSGEPPASEAPAAEGSAAPAVAPEVTGDDLLDHPNVRAAKKRIAAEKATAKGGVDLRTLTKGERRKEKARRKKQAKIEAREAKKLARAEKLEAKKAAKLARAEAKKAKREAKLAKKTKRGPGRPRKTGGKRASAAGHEKGGAVIFTVRVQAGDAKKLLAAAKGAGKTLSEYIRAKLHVE